MKELPVIIRRFFMGHKQDKSNKADPKSYRHTDANPEVKDASPLGKTQEQQKEELSKHSGFEQRTGVNPDELDTRPVVDPDPADGKSFAERTQDTQPWKEANVAYQDRDHEKAEKASKRLNK